MPAGSIVTMPEHQRMRRLCAQGWSYRRIGVELDRDPKTVKRHTTGIPSVCRGYNVRALSDRARAQLLRAADKGMPHAHIAIRFGIKRQSVRVIVHRLRQGAHCDVSSSTEA